MESAFVEDEPVPIEMITPTIHIYPYTEETDLPNFFKANNALHYFRVLRDLMYNWTHSQSHQKILWESLLRDQAPPGLRIKENLEVIESSPQLKLHAVQIIGEAENKLVLAILDHSQKF